MPRIEGARGNPAAIGRRAVVGAQGDVMKRIATTIAVALALSTAAFAADLNSAARESGLSLSQFYTGPIAGIGTFRGKLVCLCCDLGQEARAAAECDKNGHHHALSVDGDAMIHPLITGGELAAKQVNSDDLRGKEVLVTGKYYPSVGFIFVESIRAAD